MQSVQRTSLIAQVTEQLHQEIRSGHWPVGSRIPTEAELTELTGTGRNTVREAVQALVHAGMLERRQGSGTFVVATSAIAGALSRYFADSHERDVIELWQALDVTAAALAARRRDANDMAELERLLAVRREVWDKGGPRAIAADIALHRAIVVASHNAVYLEFYDSLESASEMVVRHRAGVGPGEGPAPAFNALHDEHAAVVRAIIDGDPDRAGEAARSFFEEALAEYPDH
ncbi:MAG: FadR family transcriptional regulator [Mycobacteriaceae bacterium]|nr:FadR family transcriptional regulator [Mycobacteriaceae bacterium]